MSWTKPLAYSAGAALVAVVGSPVRQNLRPLRERADDFPLSYYPMFSAKRGRTGVVHHLVGIDEDGGEHILPHTLLGAGGLNQVRRQIAARVRQGRADLVAEAAGRALAEAEQARYRRIVRVQVVTSKHRYDDYFNGHTTPLSRTVHAEVTLDRHTSDEGV